MRDSSGVVLVRNKMIAIPSTSSVLSTGVFVIPNFFVISRNRSKVLSRVPSRPSRILANHGDTARKVYEQSMTEAQRELINYY